LGHGDQRDRDSPTLVEELECVRGVAVAAHHSLAVTQLGDVFWWGSALFMGTQGEDSQDSLRPIIVEGFGGVRVRHVCAGFGVAFAIGREGELFSWGAGHHRTLGHGDEERQPSPKRVEALRGVRVSSASVGLDHAVALADTGLVYSWGENRERALLGNPHVERELLPTPVEALRGVRVCSIAAASERSYAAADTGQLWAWGIDHRCNSSSTAVGHGEQMDCPLPKPIESLRGVKMDAVVGSDGHTLALADDGRVYACKAAGLQQGWLRSVWVLRRSFSE
jgi:alpha-tubulin suppressor-like RCC1 family protein